MKFTWFSSCSLGSMTSLIPRSSSRMLSSTRSSRCSIVMQDSFHGIKKPPGDRWLVTFKIDCYTIIFLGPCRKKTLSFHSSETSPERNSFSKTAACSFGISQPERSSPSMGSLFRYGGISDVNKSADVHDASSMGVPCVFPLCS